MSARGHRSDAESVSMAKALAADLDGAFEELVFAFQGRLYGFALRLCGDRRDAEEIAQDAFVRAYHALGGYTTERIRTIALRPWLYQITLNVARNRARRRRLKIVPLATEGNDDARPAAPPLVADERHGPEATSERAATGANLAALVTGLPARYRAAVVLRHVEGLSYLEVAAVLGQPTGTVKANVHRGVALLRTAWGAYSSAEEERHG